MTPQVGVRQRKSGDCGVAALASYLGESYEDVYVACARVDPVHRSAKGLWAWEVIKIAAVLGVKLRRRLKYDLDEDEGVLIVQFKDGHRHWVRVRNGEIYDPSDQTLTPSSEYLARYNCVPFTLLTEVQ